MVTVSLLDVSIIIVGPSPQMLAQNACSRSKIIYRFRSGDNSTLVACVFFRPTLQLNPGCEDKKAFSHLLVFFFNSSKTFVASLKNVLVTTPQCVSHGGGFLFTGGRVVQENHEPEDMEAYRAGSPV